MSSSFLGRTKLCGYVPSFTKRRRTRVPALSVMLAGTNSSVLENALIVMVVSP